MHARCASLVLGILFCGLPVAAQETQVALRILPESDRVTARRAEKQRFAATQEKLPAFEVPLGGEIPPSARAAAPRQRLEAPAALAPLRVTAERSSFLTEARIPIAQMWSGRLRFSGVQQRFHAANLYSAVNPSHWAQIAQAPGVERIVGRARVNYGVGLQLRFGR
jgi:hypothetical protein